MADFSLKTLENGIRVAHLPYKSQVAYCGLAINCGSADENKSEFGMVHFIEHMLFKGTNKRNNFQILNRLENVGGELNAYTTKEETFIYAAFPKEFLSRTAELLADISFNSTFPEEEISKEFDVILDEINSYKDSPYESIHDDFEDLIFQGHGLGHNILGTEESLDQVDSQHLFNFAKKNHYTNQIVFFVMGDYSTQKVEKIASKHLGHIPSHIGILDRKPFYNYKPQIQEINEDTYQVHYITGNIAPSIFDDDRHAMYLLNNILGGPGMNSRLNLNLREKNGLAYNIESNYTPFTANGLVTIYFGSDKKHMLKSEKIILSELKKLRNKALSQTQLTTAKRQLIGQLTIGTEHHENDFLSFGKSILHYNRFDRLEEAVAKIESITTAQIMELANTVFDIDQLSTLRIR